MPRIEAERNKTVVPKILQRKGTPDFVGAVDGLIYGVEQGRPFHNGKHDWPPLDQIQWARCQARLFRCLASKLDLFADAVEKQAKKK